jgi:hypothetical protein
MTDLNRVNSGNIDAVTAAGVITPANRDGAVTTFGVTLAAATTYFFPFGAQHAPVPAEVSSDSVHLRWDAAFIGVFTVETCNFPATRMPQDPRGEVDVSDFNNVAGFWMQENPTTAYVSGNGSGGLTVSNLTLTVAGGSAGGATIHLGNMNTRRIRVRAAVGGTGGLVRCAVWGKGL